ncbi:MAG: phosphatase PAP2 family protein [Actinobacteria bacterium]|nr:phosphatase PAP2 family protein [Actinomycetota bacterium]
MSDASPGWARRRLDPDARYGLRLTLFAIATLLVALPFAYLVLQVTRDGPLTTIDRDVARSLHDQLSEQEVQIAVLKVITNLGSSPSLYLLVGIACIYLWRRGSRRTAVYVAVTSQVGGLISAAVKLTVGRARPGLGSVPEALDKSFPSGHALNSTVVYGALLLAFMPLIPRRWRPWAVIGYVSLIGIIGATRLGLVVHYVSDVLAGYVLGFAWLAVATAVFSVWRTERGKEPVRPIEGVAPEMAPSERASGAGT